MTQIRDGQVLNLGQVSFQFVERAGAANAQTIAQMLKACLAQIRASGYPGAMPSNLEEASALLNDLNQKNVPSCETRFAQQLVDLYR